MSDWIDVQDQLPPFNTEVLIISETEQVEVGYDGHTELWPQNPYYFRLAQLRPQYRTQRPIWMSSWDGEQIEDENMVVVYWMPLPAPPTQHRRQQAQGG